ncbi:STT3 domain-containing protein [Pyrobaculum neutrophilum]|uniref:dolichyl-phosphooligosaccharide-protein glycotransferase n=1 Tax=Pyrobaculum neutrophilum (strain DSM 2338 / JCM 9278 / NBRC 100436 / V24Sta) TaxID=444157 RepID=B1YAG2_PYRNV|nr:STT3 domain-containing protein [Pyrobaculum neutrophilum]ACB40611.1 Dolichyl-diphosphooligosaccharide--protein glycotransferase [Pyrobaculum neutrophilum V24Sta]
MDRREKLLVVVPGLLAAFAIALYARMYRVFLWGWWLDEFDPYVRYYLAKYMLEHGVGWWWSGAQFTQFWHPYGIDWGRVLLPGTSLYGLFIYALLRPFGVDLWHAVIAAPAVVNSLAVFSMFYLGYRVGGELGIPNGGVRVGLAAALLTAIAPAFVERGFAAWFDDEPISLFLIPLGLALLIDGLRRPWAGALAGAALGYVVWTWGGHFYVWNLVGLYAMVLPAYYYLKLALAKPGKKSRPPELPFDARNFFLSYLLFYAVYAAFVASIPRYGVHTVASAFNILPTFGLASAALTWALGLKLGAARTAELLRRYIWAVAGVVAVGLAAFAAAIAAGLIGGKFLATLLPFGRSAIVASVAEHSTTQFIQILSRYGPLIPFIVASLPYLFTPSGLLALTYLVTAGYAAATMVRLLVLLAPGALIAAAVGMVKLFDNRRFGHIVMAAAVVSTVMLLSAVMPAVSQGQGFVLGLARQPTQIATSAVGAVSDDFIDALMWLKTRLPPYEPVASWWDYGYWISVVGNKTSLADNSTINATQIGEIGLAFMAPPQVGAAIFTKQFGTKYVLAIMPYAIYPATLPTGLQTPLLVHEYPPGGDFLKSYWMTRIALENVRDAADVLKARGMSPEDYIYTRAMSYPGPPPNAAYAYFTIGGSYYPVPLDLNRTLYAMLFSKERFFPIYGNYSQFLPWIFEGVEQPGGGFTSFRSLRLVGGNVYLPTDITPQLQSLGAYVIKGWDRGGVDVVVDPLTNATQRIPLVTADPRPLRLVYVSKPYGWVVVYEVEGS